jgi:hypothetical protein
MERCFGMLRMATDNSDGNLQQGSRWLIDLPSFTNHFDGKPTNLAAFSSEANHESKQSFFNYLLPVL